MKMLSRCQTVTLGYAKEFSFDTQFNFCHILRNYKNKIRLFSLNRINLEPFFSVKDEI